jgi:hypothetical protein
MEPTLFDKTKSPRLVYSDVAILLGSADSALFLQQVHFWLSVYVNKKDKSHYRDNRWWIWNSYPEWLEQLPWLSVKIIRRITGELREMGLLLVMRGPGRGTLWYTIDYDKLKEFMYGESNHINTPDPAPQGRVSAPQGRVSTRSKGRVSLQRIPENTQSPDAPLASQEELPDADIQDVLWTMH